MADDERIRLRAVQQRQADAGEGRMEQRSLPLDHIPVVGIVVRRQRFGGAGGEVRHHRVDGDAGAGDENAGLAGGAKIGFDAALLQFSFDGQRRVLLADGAVGAHRQQTLAAALAASRRGEDGVRMAHVEELAAKAVGGLGDGRHVAQPGVQAAGYVQSRFQRGDDGGVPVLGQGAAGIDGADDQRLRALRGGFGDADIVDAEVRAAAGQSVLADDDARSPIDDALAGLGR